MRARREEQNRAQSVGKVRVADKIEVRFVALNRSRAHYVCERVQRLRIGHILNKVTTRLVDVWIDDMGRDGGGLQGELDPYISADLPDPNVLAAEADRAEPESGVIAFVHRGSRLLGCTILLAAIQV